MESLEGICSETILSMVRLLALDNCLNLQGYALDSAVPALPLLCRHGALTKDREFGRRCGGRRRIVGVHPGDERVRVWLERLGLDRAPPSAAPSRSPPRRGA